MIKTAIPIAIYNHNNNIQFTQATANRRMFYTIALLLSSSSFYSILPSPIKQNNNNLILYKQQLNHHSVDKAPPLPTLYVMNITKNRKKKMSTPKIFTISHRFLLTD